MQHLKMISASIALFCWTALYASDLGQIIIADRDNYVKILWENIAEDHKYNFNQHLHDGKDFGAYDYSSIMHYGPLAFSKNGEKTIIPLVGEITIGQRNQLSAQDITAVNAMYPEI